MKIALVNSEYPTPTGIDHGGIATYTYTLANLLANNGHTVHLISRQEIYPDEISSQIHQHQVTFRKYSNPFQRIFSRFLKNGETYWMKGVAFDTCHQLQKLADRGEIDIFEYPEYGGLGYFCDRIRKVPGVVTLHTPTELVDHLNEIPPTKIRNKLYEMEKRSIEKAFACKFPSEAIKRYATEHYQIKPTAATVLRNPFDAESARVKYVPKQSEHGGPFNVLFSGRLEYRKGAELLLRTIKRILSIHTDVNVTIAGETELKHHQNYRAAIERILTSEERKRVWFLGAVPRKNLFALYKNSSCFLFPSLFENAPYALLEAMANGLPVVASDRGGIPEFVEHGINGLLFSPDDPDEPVKSITTIFNNREKGIALGLSAELSIDKSYHIGRTVEEYINYFQMVIDKFK